MNSTILSLNSSIRFYIDQARLNMDSKVKERMDKIMVSVERKIQTITDGTKEFEVFNKSLKELENNMKANIDNILNRTSGFQFTQMLEKMNNYLVNITNKISEIPISSESSVSFESTEVWLTSLFLGHHLKRVEEWLSKEQIEFKDLLNMDNERLQKILSSLVVKDKVKRRVKESLQLKKSMIHFNEKLDYITHSMNVKIYKIEQHLKALKLDDLTRITKLYVTQMQSLQTAVYRIENTLEKAFICAELIIMVLIIRFFFSQFWIVLYLCRCCRKQKKKQ